MILIFKQKLDFARQQQSIYKQILCSSIKKYDYIDDIFPIYFKHGNIAECSGILYSIGIGVNERFWWIE